MSVILIIVVDDGIVVKEGVRREGRLVRTRTIVRTILPRKVSRLISESPVVIDYRSVPACRRVIRQSVLHTKYLGYISTLS